MTYALAYLLLSLCAGVLWCRLARFTDEEHEMMTYTPTRRPLLWKLFAWAEVKYMAWRIKHAERDVLHIRQDRVAAYAHADRLSQRIEAYEAHITVLAQRLGRARWK